MQNIQRIQNILDITENSSRKLPCKLEKKTASSSIKNHLAAD